MNTTEPNSNSLASSQQAVNDYLGDQFLDWLNNTVALEVNSWPELKVIASTTPKIEKIKKFMLQRFLAAEAFLGGREGDPGFLGFALANLSESNDPLAESAWEILEKKKQEQLSGALKSQWIKLLHALGASDEEIKRTEPKEPTRNYVAELSDVYSNSEWQTAMGAFVAHERALPEENQVLLGTLSKMPEISADDLAVLKGLAPMTHILDKIAFDQENKGLVWEGAKRQLDARHDFYKGLMKYLES